IGTGIYNTAYGAATSRKSNKNNKIPGIALVGLGGYASGQLAPALQETKHCRLTGIVTGTPAKEGQWMEKYNIPGKNVYNYDNFDSIADNDDIDIIYIVLPNSMHAEYSIRAAKAGKHVICEKPMTTTVEDAKAIIKACNDNNVKLSLGYRLHFEPHNLRAMELGQEEKMGKVLDTDAEFSFVLNSKSWRLDKEMAGGGPLVDIGIYTIQGACYTKGQWPVEVEARYGEVTKPDLFDSVEQSISFTLKYPDGTTSTHNTSYADKVNYLKTTGENGWWEISPAYSYSNISGETSEGQMNFPNVNQQARQMDAFALSLINDTPILVTGDMGLRDMIIMEAIYKAADTGKSVPLELDNLDIPLFDLHKKVNEKVKTSMS
ncbi:MAG: Gfo/Idh/MocA family protein, partial [Marinilabilia sp.]